MNKYPEPTLSEMQAWEASVPAYLKRRRHRWNLKDINETYSDHQPEYKHTTLTEGEAMRLSASGRQESPVTAL